MVTESDTALLSAVDALAVAVEMRVDCDEFWAVVVERLAEMTTESLTAFESAVAAFAVAVLISNDWLELSDDSAVATEVAMLRAVESVAT